jgi:hypothetical protein
MSFIGSAWTAVILMDIPALAKGLETFGTTEAYLPHRAKPTTSGRW